MLGDFVIQVRPDIDLDRGVFSGRVEHMDSGQSARFRTVDELAAFVFQCVQAQCVQAQHVAPASDPTSRSNENLTAD
jgi:hypothetical protein